jgi:hypothetical protein
MLSIHINEVVVIFKIMTAVILISYIFLCEYTTTVSYVF